MDNRDKSVSYVYIIIWMHILLFTNHIGMRIGLYVKSYLLPRNNKYKNDKSLTPDGFNNSVTQVIVNAQ